ncbi:MAG: efflux RND transporter permease subunit, partial [Clostridia bacterium]|nr:efflux RND transporter permease subunit [Clostridia bacterium]
EEAIAAFDAADAMLKEQGYEGGLDDVDKALSDLEDGIAACEGYLNDVEAGYAELDAAQKELDNGRDALAAGKAQAASELAKGEKTINDSAAMLASSEEEMKAASDLLSENRGAIDDALEEALKAADVKNIVTMQMVSGVLFAENFEMPAGYVKDGDDQLLVRVGDAFDEVESLSDLLLFDMGMEDMEPVRLSDVAEVTVEDNRDETYARINGQEGILLSISKQSGVATADVSEALVKKFASLEEKYEGLHFTTLMDQGDYIDIIVGSVLENMVVGAVLAIIILLIFLWDFRPTFIVACSIPISITFAIVLMYFSGVTINIISLAGLAAGVGMLVDNSIVVIENVYRLRSLGLSPIKSAVSGTVQVAGAIISSTLTTVCVFFPIVFVEGLTRELFQDMALTITYSLMASLIVALTLIPAMAPGVLKRDIRVTHKRERLSNGFRKIVTFCLNRKLVALGLAILLLFGSAALSIGKGFTYMPEMETPQLMASVNLPEEAKLEDTKKIADEFSEGCLEIKGVGTVGTMLSGGIAGVIGMSDSSSAVNSATMYILLAKYGEKHTKAVTSEIEKLAEDINLTAGEDTVSVTGGSSMSAMSALVGSGITLTLYGDDLEKLASAADEVSVLLKEVEGVDEVSGGSERTDPVLNVRVDKEKAMKEGLTVAQVFQEVASALASSASATTVTTAKGDYDIIVISEKAEDMTRKDLEGYTIKVTGRDGEEKSIKLSDIASIEEGRTLQSINRADQRRYVSVSASVAEGHNVTLVARDAEKALKDYEAPEGVTYEFAGENESIMDAMVQLFKMLLIGVVLVYLIMVAQFQSLRSPFIVMFTIPLAFTGAFIALLIWNMEISIVAMIGLIMLVGIIVNNGIVLVDYINQLRAGGMERREAIIEAASTRIRPILMTALTTILAMVPIALGFGQGASIIQPVAVTCIGGLAYATLMTLFIIPVMYELLSSRKVRTVSEEDLEISEL